MVSLQTKSSPSRRSKKETFYLATHNPSNTKGLRSHLRSMELEFTEPYDDLLAICVTSSELQSLCEHIETMMSRTDIERAMCLLVPEGVEPSVRDMLQMQPLGALIRSVQSQWLTEMLQEKRLLSHFQPIVYTADPGRILAYECLLRSTDRDGTTIYPDRLFGVARSTDLLSQLDQAARLMAVNGASEHHVRTKLFINYDPSAIGDPGRSLRSTLRALQDAGFKPNQVVFEMVETSEKDLTHLLNIVTFLKAKGFKVALDDLGCGYNSLSLLPQLRPEYIKLNIEFIRGIDHDPYKGKMVARLLDLVRSLGIKTIAEGVETKSEWRWALEHGADYVQGYLFARPATPPPLPRTFSQSWVNTPAAWASP